MKIEFEDDVIRCLCKWLETRGWKIEETSIGHKHGCDIVARKDGKRLIVEAKGRKGNPRSHVTKRPKFDSGQIKDHFGKALVKILEERNKDQNAIIAIAQPNDNHIRECLKHVIPEVKKSDIKLYWIESAEIVEEE
ncbi:MAG: hypothetical protein V1887_02820 [Candidatus Aenigmatarchaeota archaeon]